MAGRGMRGSLMLLQIRRGPRRAKHPQGAVTKPFGWDCGRRVVTMICWCIACCAWLVGVVECVEGCSECDGHGVLKERGERCHRPRGAKVGKCNQWKRDYGHMASYCECAICGCHPYLRSRGFHDTQQHWSCHPYLRSKGFHDTQQHGANKERGGARKERKSCLPCLRTEGFHNTRQQVERRRREGAGEWVELERFRNTCCIDRCFVCARCCGCARVGVCGSHFQTGWGRDTAAMVVCRNKITHVIQQRPGEHVRSDSKSVQHI